VLLKGGVRRRREKAPGKSRSFPPAAKRPSRNYAWYRGQPPHYRQDLGGRVGRLYAHTSFGGFTQLQTATSSPKWGKEAVIRRRAVPNAGGALATDIVEFLAAEEAQRGGHARRRGRSPARRGPSSAQVMLINEFAGSGRRRHALLLHSRRHRPLDRSKPDLRAGWSETGRRLRRHGRLGYVTAPARQRVEAESEWIAENVGIAPDIESQHPTPRWCGRGKTRSSTRPSKSSMAELAKNPARKIRRPAFPDHYKK